MTKLLTALILPNNSLFLKQCPNSVLTFFLFNEMIFPRITKGRFKQMDLSVPSKENVIYMIDQMKDKLRMVNVDAMKSENFDEANYEDLVYLYEMIMKRDTFSPSEMQAIVAELGALRK